MPIKSDIYSASCETKQQRGLFAGYSFLENTQTYSSESYSYLFCIHDALVHDLLQNTFSRQNVALTSIKTSLTGKELLSSSPPDLPTDFHNAASVHRGGIHMVTDGKNWTWLTENVVHGPVFTTVLSEVTAKAKAKAKRAVLNVGWTCYRLSLAKAKLPMANTININIHHEFLAWMKFSQIYRLKSWSVT